MSSPATLPPWLAPMAAWGTVIKFERKASATDVTLEISVGSTNVKSTLAVPNEPREAVVFAKALGELSRVLQENLPKPAQGALVGVT